MAALGATDTSLPALTTGVSQLDVGSLATPRLIEIPFVQTFTPSKIFTLSLATSRIASIMSLFETVKLVSLSFSVEVSGRKGKLSFAATEGNAPTTDLGWLSAVVYQRFSGNEQGDTYAEYVFPSLHPFSKELKALAVGNPPPKFHFRFSGDGGDSASVRGKIVLQGGGSGIISAMFLTEVVPTK